MGCIEWARFALFLGLALTSAGVLWGFYFSVKGRQTSDRAPVWHYLSVQMLLPMLFGSCLLIGSWWVYFVSVRNVVLSDLYSETAQLLMPELVLLESQFIPIVGLVAVILLGLWFIRKDHRRTWAEFEWMYLGTFLAIMAFILMPLFVWNFSVAFEWCLYTLALAYGAGTVFIFTFLFFRNHRVAERMPLFYETLEPMCTIVLSGLAMYTLVILFQSDGTIYLDPVFQMQQILFGLLLCLSAWISGPLLDSGIEAHRTYREFDVVHPERRISSYLLFGVYLVCWFGFLATNIFDFSLFSFRELLAGFLVCLGIVLFIISFSAPFILSEPSLFLKQRHSKMPMHGNQRRHQSKA